MAPRAKDGTSFGFQVPGTEECEACLKSVAPTSRRALQLQNAMKVLKPRSRMISIRLSEEEYEGLCRLSAMTGAHSLSDLARNAMRLFLTISTHEQSTGRPHGGSPGSDGDP